MKKIFYIFIALSFCACARPLLWDVETNATGPFTYGPPTNVSFMLSTNQPAESATHTLTFDIKEGDLETYQAVITYPDQFTFNGFLVLGASGTQIGSYSVDFDFDGTIDFVIPVYSVDNNNAYGDRDLSGDFHATIDTTVVYSNVSGDNVFTTTLPFGGDGMSQTITGPFTERLIAVLNAGLLTNPASSGIYNGTGVFTSVDPDNDGADDSAGEPPQTLNFTKPLRIGPPLTTPATTILLND